MAVNRKERNIKRIDIHFSFDRMIIAEKLKGIFMSTIRQILTADGKVKQGIPLVSQQPYLKRSLLFEGKEKETMTQFAPPICISCKHYHYARNRNRMPDTRTCKAFPDGIPKQVYYMEHDHRQPFKGDRGIVYEENPDWKKEFESRKGDET